MKRQVLVADDSQQSFTELQNALQGQDIGVSHAASMADTLDRFRSQFYCLIVIDIRVPWNDLLALIRRLREIQTVPVIVLLAGPLKTEEVSALFQAGVSLLLKKPVNYDLLAVQALNLISLFLGKNEGERLLTFNTNLVIDPLYHRVTANGQPLNLTKKEFGLLLCLARHPGQILSREQLYRQVWNDDYSLGGYDTVKVHVGILRKKLSAAGIDCIQTVRGFGYKFTSFST